MITRKLEQEITLRLGGKKAIVVLGARQVGKTTLLKSLFSGDRHGVFWLNGDDADTQELMRSVSADRFRALLGNAKTLVVDEAQRIPDIGLKLKILIDQIPSIQIVATGSSSFALANKINEPLTGRKWEYRLHPLSFAELAASKNALYEKRLLPHRLVYGSYPEVVTSSGDEQAIITGLANDYLYKDILTLEGIHKADKLVNLVKALAYQIGSEVSYNELSRLIGLDVKTIEKYITILEQAFIVFRLRSFSRNMRNELKHSRKIYFYDNGIRNAVIRNFSPAELRGDVGSLFENYFIAEMQKKRDNNGDYSQSWFWRTTAQQEIDYIEERDGKLSLFEIKWNQNRKASVPLSFSNNYDNYVYNVVNRENYYEFLQ
ncbi:MAG: ATP-binding protein [Muribaculaceae bacterium]|nr:ATP-binding protein [Muribaculaceae bacterium]